MEINEVDEKQRSLLKADKPVSQFSAKELEARKSLLWDLIKSKFNDDVWAVAEICEIEYTLTRKEIEGEEQRMNKKAQSTDGLKEWEPLNRKKNNDWEKRKS